jgi:hypothetical protein
MLSANSAMFRNPDLGDAPKAPWSAAARRRLYNPEGQKRRQAAALQGALRAHLEVSDFKKQGRRGRGSAVRCSGCGSAASGSLRTEFLRSPQEPGMKSSICIGARETGETSMKYDFDQDCGRQGTDSVKWSLYPEGVLPLWVADMDFRSAEPILQALRDRVEHGVFGYTRPAPALKRAIRERMKNLYGWEIKEEEILLIPGVVTGLNIAIQAYSGIGEAVLAQPPVYFHFLRDPVHNRRVLQDPPLVKSGDSYEIDFDGFEKSITEQTRLFIL